MTRVVGIDPGTVSIDVCGIVDGQMYLDRSWPTAEVRSDPAGLVELLTKSALFQGGVTSFLERAPALGSVAAEAYIEGATKAARHLRYSASSADEILLSGRNADDAEIRNCMETGLADVGPVRLLTGFATIAKQGGQGATLIADGLAGGAQRLLVDRLRIREARGTVVDHLIFVSPAVARRRLGIEAGD